METDLFSNSRLADETARLIASNLTDEGNLPPSLYAVMTSVSRAFDTPKAYTLISLLTAAGTTAGKSCCLHAANHVNYPQMWSVLVGPPSAGKTDPIKFAFAPLWEISRRLLWPQTKEGEPEQTLIANDCTQEARNRLQAANRYGIVLLFDEIAELLNSIGRYGKNGELQQLLSIWANSTYSVHRASKESEPIHVAEPFLSIIGGIQPSVIANILSKTDYSGNGFLSRFFWVIIPEYERQDYTPDNKMPAEITELWQKMICAIYELRQKEQTIFRLSDDAERIYGEYKNSHKREKNELKQEIYGKCDVHCLRLALVMRIIWLMDEQQGNVDDVMPPDLITEREMSYAVGCMEYFSRTCYQVMKASQPPSQERKLTAQDVAKWLLVKDTLPHYEIANAVNLSEGRISQIWNEIKEQTAEN